LKRRRKERNHHDLLTRRKGMGRRSLLRIPVKKKTKTAKWRKKKPFLTAA